MIYLLNHLLSKEELIKKNKKLIHPKYFKNFQEEHPGICLCLLIDDLEYDKENPNEFSYSVVDIKILPFENLNSYLNKNKNNMSHYIYKKWNLESIPHYTDNKTANWNNFLIWDSIESLFISLKINIEDPPYVHPNQLKCWKTAYYIKKHLNITKYAINRIVKQNPEIKIKIGDIDFYHFYSFLCYYDLAPTKIYDNNYEWINQYYEKIHSSKH
jgi:hypothetical protein